MMFQTALLIVTRPVSWVRGQIPVYLSEINKLVSKTVYIHIQPETSEVTQSYKYAPKIVPYTWEIRNLVKEFYSSSAATCGSLDIRVLLENVSNSNKNFDGYKLKSICDIVMIDRSFNSQTESDILTSVCSCFNLKTGTVMQSVEFSSDSEDETKKQKFDDDTETTGMIEQVGHTVLGGTFDRLHTGHKLLLSEGCLLGTKSLTVGVTEGDMNAKKTLCELILPSKDRIDCLREFLEDIKPSLDYKLEPISDMFGPSTVDPDLDLIVLSQETQRGGAKINTEREKKGLKTLEEYTIQLIEDKCHSQFEEEKVSSSSLRKRLLGTLFHPIKAGVDMSERPYIIGLTGGIASGKSAICKRLEGLGAVSVDCDKLGHKAYVKGTPGFDKVVAAFGADIVGQDGEVDRKVLGGKVFSDKSEMEKLNNIVWPEIADMAKKEIQDLAKVGHSVVVLEAAVLLEAGWDSFVHEVWVTIIPSDERRNELNALKDASIRERVKQFASRRDTTLFEISSDSKLFVKAVRRMMERNKLSEDQAKQRLASQISNIDRVQKSNVIFSSLWAYEYTQSQVENAWKLLQGRIGVSDENKHISNL